MSLCEGDLRLDNEADFVSMARLDQQGDPTPHGMSLVDWVLDHSKYRLLVEIKDPSNPAATPDKRADFANRIRSEGLVNETLVPKCRDSYTYLHLMAQDDKPMVYVVVLGGELLRLDAAARLALQDRVNRRLRQEAARPWERQYVVGCVVYDTASPPADVPLRIVRISSSNSAPG